MRWNGLSRRAPPSPPGCVPGQALCPLKRSRQSFTEAPVEFLLLMALLLVPATNRVGSRIIQDTSRAASLLLGGNRDVQSGKVTVWQSDGNVIADTDRGFTANFDFYLF